jgi:hypothetical protein
MEQNIYFEYCVYTIKHSRDLAKLLLTNKYGTFSEKNKWVEAKKMFEKSKSNNKKFIVIFAPAEVTGYLHSWATLTDIKISDDNSSTVYSFTDLTKIIEYENGVKKSELILKSSGKNINENFIRPYALCKTPYDIIENYSLDKNELEEYYYETLQEDGKRDNGIEKILNEINNEMKEISPERREIEINKIFRNDTAIVNMLKRYYNYRCQFPGCNARIQTKSGTDYVEVAHIIPVSEGGKSILKNLLVLCPNHHKEFDLGIKEILKWDNENIEGKLNGQDFKIKFKKDI